MIQPECVSSPGQKRLLARCDSGIRWLYTESSQAQEEVKDDQRARWVQQGLWLVKLTLLMFSGEMRCERGECQGRLWVCITALRLL